ncbi:MAG: nucleoside 2-deoxyribosyltransferase [Nitrospiraceae bacterium]
MSNWKMSFGGGLVVYCGGPIELVERDTAMDWRDDAAEYGRMPKNNLYMVNPFREGGESPHRGKKNSRLIERRDLFLADKSDVLLINLNNWDDGKGTLIELGWFDVWRKPVFAWAGEAALARLHPMVDDIVAYWNPDLHTVIDQIAEFTP